MRLGFVGLLLATLFCTGCSVERTLTVQSNPPGALVWLNDQEIGRTPVTHSFRWYGVYDVEVRKEGYQALKTTGSVMAPWWQWVPFDFLAELTPGHHVDHHELTYTLEPASDQPADAQLMVTRGQQLESRLESGERTRTPDTQPTTAASKKRSRSTTKASTVPATEPVSSRGQVGPYEAGNVLLPFLSGAPMAWMHGSGLAEMETDPLCGPDP